MEATPQIDDERMLNALEHVLLVVGVLNLFEANDFFLAQDFDRVVPQIMVASHCPIIPFKQTAERLTEKISLT